MSTNNFYRFLSMKKILTLVVALTWMGQGALFAQSETPTLSIFTDGEVYGSFRQYTGSRYDLSTDNSAAVRFPGIGVGLQYNFGAKKNWSLDVYSEYVSDYGIMLDQFSITHAFMPQLKLTAGLFGLPIGHCNTDYGYTDYFTTGDPEGEFAMIPCPMTETGLALSGEFDCGFNYFASVTTGMNAQNMTPWNWAVAGYQGFIPEVMNIKSPAYTLRLGYSGLEGFQCGAGVYYCGNTAKNADAGAFGDDYTTKNPMLIWYADAEYACDWFTIRGSYLHGYLKNANALSDGLFEVAFAEDPTCVREDFGTIATNAMSCMAEVGWNLKGCFYADKKGPELYPFAHYEYYNTQERVIGDAIPCGKVHLWSFGLNWRPIDELMVKCNYTMRKVGGQSDWNQNEVNIGLAWDLTIFEK